MGYFAVQNRSRPSVSPYISASSQYQPPLLNRPSWAYSALVCLPALLLPFSIRSDDMNHQRAKVWRCASFRRPPWPLYPRGCRSRLLDVVVKIGERCEIIVNYQGEFVTKVLVIRQQLWINLMFEIRSPWCHAEVDGKVSDNESMVRVCWTFGSPEFVAISETGWSMICDRRIYFRWPRIDEIDTTNTTTSIASSSFSHGVRTKNSVTKVVVTSY